jgi:hypothetical protein
MDVDEVVHFQTGEPIAKVSRANGGLIQRDMRHALRAREALREIPIDDLIDRVKRAGELYATAELPMGDGAQTPDAFVRAQSATTGLPERLCRANMKKNMFVLTEMRHILTSLTRGLNLQVLTSGFGEERGVPISYQAQSPVLGLVLPSNSPGVHTLWLPIIPMQIGLVLKPGPQEPWTPFRMASAFVEAGVPREAISIYPGEADVGAAVLAGCERSLVFGGQPTVDRYRGNPKVQAHGPGFSKILLGDDVVDTWEAHLDVMVECVRQQRPRLHQRLRHLGQPPHTTSPGIAKRLADVRPLPPIIRTPRLRRLQFRVATAISQSIVRIFRLPASPTRQRNAAMRLASEGRPRRVLVAHYRSLRRRSRDHAQEKCSPSRLSSSARGADD